METSAFVKRRPLRTAGSEQLFIRRYSIDKQFKKKGAFYDTGPIG
jgi:hypothetical protein